jgi:hypothetical protein
MRLVRKHDPQLREDGFAMLTPVAADVLPQLIAASAARRVKAEQVPEPPSLVACWCMPRLPAATVSGGERG